MNKKKYSNRYFKKYLLIFSISLCAFFNITIIDNNENNTNKVYAIEKPTYADMVKNKYGEEMSDEKAQSLAQEESTLKEAYTKGLGEVITSELETTSEYATYYGKYPNGFTGAVNYRRKNFLLTAYSLRDISSDYNMQPLISAVKEIPNYLKLGFNNNSWNIYGMTSKNMIRWIINQFEPKKLLRVYENSDYLILSAIYSGDYSAIMKEKDNLNEVVTIIGTNGIEFLDEGDLLLNYDTENDKLNYVGIYLGKDEDGNPYSLSPNKLVLNSSDYAINATALSYVNSSDVYIQNINGNINLVSGTKYNYGIKLKFLK